MEMPAEPLIYVNRDGQIYGPYKRAEALEHLKSGALVADDLARLEGRQNWMALLELIYPVKGLNPPKRNPMSVANWGRGTGLVIASLAVLLGGGGAIFYFSNAIPSVFTTKGHSLSAQEFKTKALLILTVIEESSYKDSKKLSSGIIQHFRESDESDVIDGMRLSLETKSFKDEIERQEKFFSIIGSKIEELAECPIELNPLYKRLILCHEIANELHNKTYSIPRNAKEYRETIQAHQIDFEVTSESLRSSLEGIN